MRFEKPQSGNPNQLTVNQHVLPRASIERFQNTAKKVEVCRRGEKFFVSPEDAVFCARRVWDEKAEKAHLTLESDFQVLASKIVSNPSTTLDSDENALATSFFALVCARTIARRNPIPDQELIGAKPVSTFDKDAMEKLEKIGYTVLSQAGSVPGRMLAGPILQIQMQGICNELKGAVWNVVLSDSADFIVSDSIDRVPAIPVSPKIMLCIDKHGTLTPEEVQENNETAKHECDLYYFGNDLGDH